MTGASGRLRPDPRRKARFREIARGIVAKDRYNRKYGIAVDIETFRGIEAAPVAATFRDALKTAGWDTIDRNSASSLFKYPRTPERA